MVDINYNVLMLHNLTRICIDPLDNPESLLHTLILQLLIDDVL